MMNTKKKPFVDEVVEEMGDGPADGEDFGVEMSSEEEGDDETAHADRVMAVKRLGKALGVQVADPEGAAEAFKALVDSCY